MRERRSKRFLANSKSKSQKTLSSIRKSVITPVHSRWTSNNDFVAQIVHATIHASK